MLMLFNPIMLMATSVGSIINKMLPGGVILIMILLIGAITLVINVLNGIKRYKKENKKIEENKNSDDKKLKDEKIEDENLNLYEDDL